MTLAAALITLVACEALLFLLVGRLRRSFPWLITGQDEVPALDPPALKKFIESSFDPHLGWVRKPNTTGVENGRKGKITFHVDELGSRSYGCSEPPALAAFGDSYAFCRQVEDDETWEAILSRREGFGCLNFGVGNYGIDQGLLRYESMTLPDSVRVVVMGFVPETICRIQSYWKHYLEFGNTFAFKPRFVLDGEGKLVLLENLMQSPEDFARLPEKLPLLRRHDSFYRTKFRSYQFRFPYLWSLLRNPRRSATLIPAVAVRELGRSFGACGAKLEGYPFSLVMKDNLQNAHELYRDPGSTGLLTAILARFTEEAERRGHIPLIVVMPQLLDIKLNENREAPYRSYFQGLTRQLPVLDMTETFARDGYENLYVNDQYGGHLSVEGNRLVAEAISTWLKNSDVDLATQRTLQHANHLP